MKSLRRLTTTLVASFDQTVSSMEDHEAIVDATIRDSKKATARATFKLKKMCADNQQLISRIAELRQQSEKWEARALGSHEDSQSDAIKCIAERNRCTDKIETLSTRLSRQQELEARARESVNRLIERTDSLISKRSELSSRAATARATEIVDRLEGEDGLNIHDTLERWEERVFESEALSDIHTFQCTDNSTSNDFSDKYRREEDQQKLDQDLASLIARNNSSSDDAAHVEKDND